MALRGRSFYNFYLMYMPFCRNVLPVNKCTYGLQCRKKGCDFGARFYMALYETEST
jgi:hypothetical protein